MTGPAIRRTLTGGITGAGVAQVGVSLGAYTGGWSIAIGFALGGLMGLLNRPAEDRIGTEKRTVTQLVRSAISPVRWIIGRALTGGVVVFARTTTPARGTGGESYAHADLHLAVVLGEGPCDAIEELRIDGQRVQVERVQRTGAGQSGAWIVPRQATLYGGRVLVAEYFAADGEQGDSLWSACAADAGESDQPDWTPAHRLQGKSWVHVWIRQGRNRQNADGEFIEGISDGIKFEGIPEIQFLIRGLRFTWPGQAAPVWTENAVAVRYWFLSTVRGIASALLDEATFARAFGTADETLEWPPFQEYPTSGLRYPVGGVIESDDDPRAIEQELDWAAQGGAPEVAGRRVFTAGRTPVPTLELTDSEIESLEGGTISPPLERRVNRLACRLPQAAPQGFEPLSLAYQNPEQLRRDGFPLTRDMGSRSLVTSPHACLRNMAKATRLYAGRVWTVRIRPTPLTLESLTATGEVILGSAQRGIGRVPCVVDEYGIEPDWTIRATVREIPPGAFADTYVEPPPLTGNVFRDVVVVRTFGGAAPFDGSLVGLYEWRRGFSGRMLIPEGDWDASTPNQEWDGLIGGGVRWPFGDAARGAKYETAEIASGGAHFDSVLVSPRWVAPPGATAADIQRQTGIVLVDVHNGERWGNIRQGPADTYIETATVASRTRVRVTIPWNLSDTHRSRNVALAGLSVILAATPRDPAEHRTSADDEYLRDLPDYTPTI